ncbi:uncharacterized protein EV420DRAFT_1761967 [Desarmillaria tabescens]|uniref:Protein kinase domain-containing protein n=1 Tax=Armillaria tabescens TaxID=1929756 RepID=A0AA39TPA9_ARMTA|nr:uncharacterized protein EV420DRAFT_1761967 [Desarmillaria tabescens]KAK0461758.1 hypothetical protein EV420DRAFT_1761967 [Desarmillaria tabescens]
MRLSTACSFLIIWTLCFLLGECRPFGLERRVRQYKKGDKITIQVRSSILDRSKTKEYECTVIGEGRDGSGKPVEAGRQIMDQAIPFDEEVQALRDVGLYIKTLNALDGTKWIVMKNVKAGPPEMKTSAKILEEATTKAFGEFYIFFYISDRGLYHFCSHEDPKPDNVFATENFSQLTLIDYGRSRRVDGLTQDLKRKIEFDSAKGFRALEAECEEKDEGGAAKTFPALIKPAGVSRISDKKKVKAAKEQEKRLEAQIRGAAAAGGGGGGGETSQQGAQQNA